VAAQLVVQILLPPARQRRQRRTPPGVVLQEHQWTRWHLSCPAKAAQSATVGIAQQCQEELRRSSRVLSRGFVCQEGPPLQLLLHNTHVVLHYESACTEILVRDILVGIRRQPRPPQGQSIPLICQKNVGLINSRVDVLYQSRAIVDAGGWPRQ
jgi:hypothetical protein